MNYIIIYFIAFTIIYLFYLFAVVLQKKRMDKFKKSHQIMFFVNRYNLDINKINIRRFTHILALVNAFIMATAFICMYLVDSLILQFIVGLAVLFPLLLITYHIVGKIYQRKYKKTR